LELLDSLNPAQRDAVCHEQRAVLVLAGAGSGKTRVLTARVAWLLDQGVPPRAILSFTFTNRAAREMRERIAGMVGEASRELWVGTFHSTAVRILRREAVAAGISPAFAIYDREDQEGLIREIARELAWPEGSWKMGAVLGAISDAKNSLVDPETFMRVAQTPADRRIAEAFERYEAALTRSGALDFDDLIGKLVMLFQRRPEVGERWRSRFHHVLVDEYQDTNHAQFRLVQSFVGNDGHVFVVGDDDQSIYGWRGADLSNVLEFETAFPGAGLVRLEQNYRSTPNILEAANAVIANNRSRKGKTLWSDRPRGVPLRFVLAGDEVEEAKRVRAFIQSQTGRGRRLSDVAVLYRTNAQSRAIETELRAARIPYEVVGGVAFYQRREVKDLLAYLRAAVQPADAVSFWRIWNTPRRGLGAALRASVERRMVGDSSTPAVALAALLREGEIVTANARAGATELLSLLTELGADPERGADQALAIALERTGYLAMLDGEEDAADRRANLEELLVAAAAAAGEGRGSLVEFLGDAALITDMDRAGDHGDRLLLLTGHNAKGLEFAAVAITGLEEGLFPHASSLEDRDELEEERRLFYVALTRAQDEVLLTAAAWRRRFDGSQGGAVSRFVDEIPAELLEREKTVSSKWSRGGSGFGNQGYGRERPRRWDLGSRAREEEPAADADDSDGGDSITIGTPLRTSRSSGAAGRAVRHPQFGYGVVLSAEDADGDLKYTVRFGTRIKKVLGRFLEEVS
jgi:DNA helicase II / ATP-dependent DNA helicase PcrA